MPTGSCLCGNIKIEYNGEPAMKESLAICHCIDCRKYTGALFTYSFVVPAENCKVTGTPKEYSVVAYNGKRMTNCFCPECGATVFRYGDSFGGKDGMKIIKVGVLDDVNVINDNIPPAELFVADRISWLTPVAGATQVDKM